MRAPLWQHSAAAAIHSFHRSPCVRFIPLIDQTTPPAGHLGVKSQRQRTGPNGYIRYVDVLLHGGPLIS